MAAMSTASSVEAYRAGLTGPGAARFEEIWTIATAAAPGASEAIKWGTPALIEPTRQRILCSVAVFRDHLNLVPTSHTIAPFVEEIEAAGLAHTNGFVQFALDAPVPVDLVRRICEHRVHDVVVNDAPWAGK